MAETRVGKEEKVMGRKVGARVVMRAAPGEWGERSGAGEAERREELEETNEAAEVMSKVDES